MYTMTMSLAFDEDAVATFEITGDHIFDPLTENPKDVGLSVRLLDLTEGYDLPLALAIVKLGTEQFIRAPQGGR